MIYNVRYVDETGAGFVFNEDVEIDKDYTGDEDLLKQAFKRELVKMLRNTTKETKITIVDWEER